MLDSNICRRLHVTDRKPLPQIIILPYGRESNFIGLSIDGDDVAMETEHIVSVFDSFSNDHPRSGDGSQDYSLLGPSMTDVHALKTMTDQNSYHVLGYFCLRGELELLTQLC